MKKTIAVIGAGALATIFVREISRLLSDDYKVVGVFSKTLANAKKLAETVGAAATNNFEEMLTWKADFVVEFAGTAALKIYALDVLQAGSDLVIASTGALADATFKKAVEEVARAQAKKVYIAGGAIGGLDLMQTVSLMGACETVIESTKAPKSLNGAPHLQGEALPEDKELCVFEGSAKEAIVGFPKNVNVAVTASLASQNPNTKVRLLSIPNQVVNTHTITVTNAQMEAVIKVSATPDPDNPKSSVSTAWSVVALLKNLAAPLVFY